MKALANFATICLLHLRSILFWDLDAKNSLARHCHHSALLRPLCRKSFRSKMGGLHDDVCILDFQSDKSCFILAMRSGSTVGATLEAVGPVSYPPSEYATEVPMYAGP